MSSLPKEMSYIAELADQKEVTESKLLSEIMTVLLKSLDPEIENILKISAITRWFNKEILVQICETPKIDEQKAEKFIEYLTKLAFVAPFENDGYSLHEMIRAYFIEKWKAENNEEFLRLNFLASTYFKNKLEKESLMQETYRNELDYHFSILGKSAIDFEIKHYRVTEDLAFEVVRKMLKDKSSTEKSEVYQKVVVILLKNAKSGILEEYRHLISKPNSVIFFKNYLEILTKNCFLYSNEIDKLQNKNENTWENFYAYLSKTCFKFLNKTLNLEIADSIFETSEIANSVAVHFLKAEIDYNYDWDFYKYVDNICKKKVLEVNYNKKRVNDSTISIDDSYTFIDNLYFKSDLKRKWETEDGRILAMEALNKLSELERMVVLQYVQGEAFIDIAQKLGKSNNTVRVIHFRALQKLRQIIMKDK